ncbi:uncharacterized protein LOC123699706 [Colias croceus]|uniref:uncharacterized protein LOC123699706 n=1 Tax=Colias crocea TaxID=72248 RepID=UPI001E27B213|nr:uncharacterized protein LOC123699706 [Colias croceus]
MKTPGFTLALTLCILHCCSHVQARQFNFRFGNNYGTTVQVIEGTILPFVYQTYRNIHIPDGMSVTYVEVQVHSLSSPKVDYDNDAQQVSIAFSITQLSMSSYKIIVKAAPTNDVLISKEYFTIH